MIKTAEQEDPEILLWLAHQNSNCLQGDEDDRD